MDPIDQIKLRSLMNISSGIPEVPIGVIDGPVDFDHPAFQGSHIRTINDSQLAMCKNSSGIACMHGTFVVGILSAQRGEQAPSICPGCKIIIRPIFNDTGSLSENNIKFPSSNPRELANGIIEVVDAGAKIINLSLGLSTSSLVTYNELENAYNYALRKGVVIVAAAGNQGNIGFFPILDHHWIIPVAACDEINRLLPVSNISPSIAKRGVMAPGINIRSTTPKGGYRKLSGTSFSAPFVTGTIALLWSIFKEATPQQIVLSIRGGAYGQLHRTMSPTLCNAERSKRILETLT